jgi:hypothetical protein
MNTIRTQLQTIVHYIKETLRTFNSSLTSFVLPGKVQTNHSRTPNAGSPRPLRRDPRTGRFAKKR